MTASRPCAFAALLALAACAPSPPAAHASADASPPTAAAVDREALGATSWMLVAINGRSVLADPGAQRIALRFEGGKAVGEAPCNVMSSDFVLDAGTMRFSPIAASKRACDALALEREYFEALAAVESATLVDGRLELEGGGRRLSFHRIAFKR